MEDIRSYRHCLRSNATLASSSLSYPRVVVDFSLSLEHDATFPTAVPIDWHFLEPEEEIAQVNIFFNCLDFGTLFSSQPNLLKLACKFCSRI